MIFSDPSTLKAFTEACLASVKNITERHFASYRDRGIGLLYGDKSKYAKMDSDARKAHLRKHSKGRGTLPELEETSCVGYVWRHIKAGYTAIDRQDRIEDIRKVMRAHASDGNYILLELRKDGWESVYWNPDVNVPADGHAEHPSTYRQAIKTGKYYVVPIQHYLVNYRRSKSDRETETTGIGKLSRTPLWFGTGWGAYHCFLGYVECSPKIEP